MFENKEPTEKERASDGSLMKFCGQQPPLETELIALAEEVREEDGKSGLPVQEALSADIRDGIKSLLQEAVQREAKAEYEL